MRGGTINCTGNADNSKAILNTSCSKCKVKVFLLERNLNYDLEVCFHWQTCVNRRKKRSLNGEDGSTVQVLSAGPISLNTLQQVNNTPIIPHDVGRSKKILSSHHFFGFDFALFFQPRDGTNDLQNMQSSKLTCLHFKTSCSVMVKDSVVFLPTKI